MVPTLRVLPAGSAMPPGPPRRRTEYCVEAASAVDGVRVTVLVAAEYVIAAGTSAFEASRSSNVDDVIVAGSTVPLNVAEMLPSTDTSEAPDAGRVIVTVGGSCEAVVMLQLLTTPNMGSPNTAFVHAVPLDNVL